MDKSAGQEELESMSIKQQSVQNSMTGIRNGCIIVTFESETMNQDSQCWQDYSFIVCPLHTEARPGK